MENMQVSHTSVDLYNTCGMKYKFKYVDRLEADKTPAALLFGGAIDNALNYILEAKRDGKQISIIWAEKIFIEKMETWHGQNELVFFKNESPFEGASQKEVFDHLLKVGCLMLQSYVINYIDGPFFKRIVDVQISKKIENDDGDHLKMVIDFIAEAGPGLFYTDKTPVPEGTLIVLDNKTCGDLSSYTKSSVKKSPQLATYTEFYPEYKSAYIAMQKRLEDDTIVHKIVIDTIPEETIVVAFEAIANATSGIKAEIYEKNEKSCYNFGKKCDYWAYCKYGDDRGLIERKKYEQKSVKS